MTVPQPISTDPPAPEEIEVTVMGCGTGECCVVHLGDGEWIVVDSFVHKATATTQLTRSQHVPAAQYYFRDVLNGAVAPEAVKCIILSHLHADHYRGLRDLHTYCTEAQLVLPATLNAGMLAGLFGSQARQAIHTVHQSIELARHRTLASREAIVWVTGGWSDFPNRIRALSPTGKAHTDASELTSTALATAATLAGLTSSGATSPELSRVITEVLRQMNDQNLTSIALHLNLGSAADKQGVLLTGDVVNHPDYGWESIVTTMLSQSPTAAGLIKIAHHGSKAAHSQALFEHHVKPDAPALVAPYASSGIPDKDYPATKLLGRTNGVYQAAPTGTHGRRNASLQIVEAFGNNEIKANQQATGIIQARWTPGQNAWTIRTQSPAEHKYT